MSDTIAMEKRLDRIEDKLDSLSHALAALARIEERQAQARDVHRVLFGKFEGLDDRYGQLVERVRKLEHSDVHASGKIRIAERVFWIVLAAVVGVAARSYG